jgi:hypothetical protein
MEVKLYDYMVEKYNIFNNNKSHSEILIHFTTITNPEIDFLQYIQRLYKYTSCSKSCFIVSLIYIEKILKKYEIANIQHSIIFKLYFVSLLVAIKWNDDDYLSNVYYSKVGGIEKEELLRLQLIFFELLDYNAFVNKEDYKKMSNDVFNYLPFATMTV